MSFRVRACIVAGLAVLRAVAELLAQQPALPTFRAGTTLVELAMVVTDQGGRPVTDLKPDEIVILQNGKPRPIEFFRFEGAAFAPGAAGPREALAPGLFTNRPEYSPGPDRNASAIVLDLLNTRPEDQVAARAQVMQFLRTLAPNTRVAVYALGATLRILHDFTADLDALRQRLASQRIEFDVQTVAADELVRRQLMEAEHLDRTVGGDADADASAEAERNAALEDDASNDGAGR